MADAEVDILEIVTLPATPGRPSHASQLPPPEIEPPSPRHHLGVIVVVLLVLGMIVLARTLGDRPPSSDDLTPATVPAIVVPPSSTEPALAAGSPDSFLGHGWRRWGGPPWLTADAAVVALGSELVAVDGSHAAVFEFSRYQWRTIEPAPLPTSTFGSRGVAAGGVAVFWSGGVVATFDLGLDRWRVAQAPPGRPHLTDGVWADRELIFVESQLSYRPDVDVWTFLHGEPPGTDWSSAWVGRDLVAVGHDVDGIVAAAYDLRDGVWTPLPRPPLSGIGVSVASRWGQVVAVDGSGGAASYDPQGRVWTPLPRTRDDGRICRAAVVALGSTVMAATCDDVVVLADDGRWVDDTGPTPRAGRLRPIGSGAMTLAPLTTSGDEPSPDPVAPRLVLWTYGP